MGHPALTSDIAHSTAGDMAAIALQYASGLDQLLAELGLDMLRARRSFAIGYMVCYKPRMTSAPPLCTASLRGSAGALTPVPRTRQACGWN